MFHELRPSVTTDMAVLPCVLGCSFDESTCPERSEGGQAHPATYHLGTVRDQSRGTGGLPGTRRKRYLRQAGSQLRGLVTSIHETSGLRV